MLRVRDAPLPRRKVRQHQCRWGSSELRWRRTVARRSGGVLGSRVRIDGALGPRPHSRHRGRQLSHWARGGRSRELVRCDLARQAPERVNDS